MAIAGAAAVLALAGSAAPAGAAVAPAHKALAKTLCAFWVKPVRCAWATSGGGPGTRVAFNKWDGSNVTEEDWTFAPRGTVTPHRGWPKWFVRDLRGKHVFLIRDLEQGYCLGDLSGVAVISHCSGPKAHNVLIVSTGQVMHRTSLIDVAMSIRSGLLMYLTGDKPFPGVHKQLPVLWAPGNKNNRPADKGQIWHRHGTA